MKRDIFTAEHDAFRETVRTFLAKEVPPHHEQWEKDGIVSRDAWLAAGQPGPARARRRRGVRRRRQRRLPLQRRPRRGVTRAGAAGLGFGLHNDIIGPYLTDLATDEQKRALAARLLLRRDHHRDRDDRARRRLRPAGHPHHRRGQGDHCLLNGSKTFISNGILADLVIVVAKTDPDGGATGPHPARRRARHGGLRARPQPRQDRPEGPGHRRAVLQRRTRPQGEPARRAGRRLRPPDDEPARRSGWRIAVAAIAAAEHLLEITTGVRQGARGLRPAARPASSTSASRSPRWPPSAPSPAPSSTAASSTTPTASSTRCTPRWPSGGPPSCRSGSPTAACSCTAATAT